MGWRARLSGVDAFYGAPVESGMRPIPASLMLCLLAACDQVATEVAKPPPHAAEPRAIATEVAKPPPHAVEPRSAPQPAQTSVSVALFGKEHLQDCWTAQLRFTPLAGLSRPSIAASLDQSVLMLLDEGIVAEAGGDTFLTEGTLGELLYSTLAGDKDLFLSFFKPPTTKPKKPLSQAQEAERAAALADPFKPIRALQWPPPSLAEEVRDGVGMKVESCEFPDKTPLGTCLAKGSPKTAGLEGAVEWSLLHVHYGVRKTADTDEGLRNCLRLGGSWKAPPRDDRAAARARLRQRATQLRDMAGALEP